MATPGRLLDHIEQGTCKLDQVQHLVLDEADRMLDMGFLPDVRRIIDRCPRKRQTSFSLPRCPGNRNAHHLGDAQSGNYRDRTRRSPAETVKHVIYPVAEVQKTDLLEALLDQVHYESVIIFCRTKHGADRIAATLKRGNHAVAVPFQSHAERARAGAERFREGKFEVLVATDIAARGLDIADVSHVINYDVPLHPEDYIHRIGRTGRAEASGDAFTLMVAEDAQHVASIERFIAKKIERIKLDGFDYRYTALFEAGKPGAAAGFPGKAVGVRVHGVIISRRVDGGDADNLARDILSVMPLYQYKCSKCDGEFEAMQSMTDKPLTKCPLLVGRQKKNAKARATPDRAGAGLIFKGSGFTSLITAAKATNKPRKKKILRAAKPASTSTDKPAAKSGPNPPKRPRKMRRFSKRVALMKTLLAIGLLFVAEGLVPAQAPRLKNARDPECLGAI